MIHEIDLLNQIHQNADMGRDSIEHLIKLSNDVEFLHTLNAQLKEYEKVYQKSEDMLCSLNAKPLEASPVAKTMAHVSSTMKSMMDPSTSKLAEMMVEGSTMGITNLTKQINAYHGDREDVLFLAKKQLKTEEDNLEELKKYL